MNKKAAFLLIALVAIVALLIAGCGKSGGQTSQAAATPTPVTARQLPADLRFVNQSSVWLTNGVNVERVTPSLPRGLGGIVSRVDGSLMEVETGQTSTVVVWMTGQFLLPISLESGEITGTDAGWPAAGPGHWAVVEKDMESKLSVLIVDGEFVFQAAEIISPAFSLDGRRLAFSARETGGPTFTIYIADLTASGHLQGALTWLLFDGFGSEHQIDPAFGDSSNVLFFASGARLWDIYSVKLNNGPLKPTRVTTTGDATNPVFYRGVLAFQRCDEFSRSRKLWPTCSKGASIWASEAGTGITWKVAEGSNPSWDRFKGYPLPKILVQMATAVPTPTPQVTLTATPSPEATETAVENTPAPVPAGEVRIIDWPCAEGLNLHTSKDVEPAVWVTFENIIYRIPEGSEVVVLESAQYESEWENLTRPGKDESFAILKVRYTDKDGKVHEGWVRENATHRPGEQPTVDRSVCATLEAEDAQGSGSGSDPSPSLKVDPETVKMMAEMLPQVCGTLASASAEEKQTLLESFKKAAPAEFAKDLEKVLPMFCKVLEPASIKPGKGEEVKQAVAKLAAAGMSAGGQTGSQMASTTVLPTCDLVNNLTESGKAAFMQLSEETKPKDVSTKQLRMMPRFCSLIPHALPGREQAVRELVRKLAVAGPDAGLAMLGPSQRLCDLLDAEGKEIFRGIIGEMAGIFGPFAGGVVCP